MADEPSASELERIIERNHRETSADILDLKSQLTANVSTLIGQFEKYVLAAVYQADERAREAVQRSQADRIARLEEEIVSARRGNRGAVLSSIGAIVAAIVVAVVLGAMKGAGH